MRGLNEVRLIGNVGKDPEVRTLEGGVKVANFSLAVTESYKDKSGERVDQVEWLNIVCWRSLAEVAEKYVPKGTLLHISGKIRTRSWEDKEGNKRFTTEIVADEFIILSSKEKGAEKSKAQSNSMNDDLPF